MGKGGKFLKEKSLFLVVQSDYHLQVGLTELISSFLWMMTLSFFKWNGSILSYDGIFLCADGKADFVFCSNF